MVHTTPDISKLPGGFIPDPLTIPVITGGNTSIENIEGLQGNAFVIHNALTAEDCQNLRAFFSHAPVAAPVSVAGFSDGMMSANTEGFVGSMRTTMWTPELSAQVWEQIKHLFGSRIMDSKTSTDWWQSDSGHTNPHRTYRHWIAVGVSPMMRFMKYEDGGEHYAHYDAGYFYDDLEHRTLMSFVMYLTTNTEGGATRFIKDEQSNLPVWERKHDDWDRQVTEDEVLHAIHPTEGSILVFDHRLCHDVQPYLGKNPRIIVRGDIIYRKFEGI